MEHDHFGNAHSGNGHSGNGHSGMIPIKYIKLMGLVNFGYSLDLFLSCILYIVYIKYINSVRSFNLKLTRAIINQTAQTKLQ